MASMAFTEDVHEGFVNLARVEHAGAEARRRG
jgi:hypothetical protein